VRGWRPLTIRVCNHSFSSCCLSNLRNPAKFSNFPKIPTYSSSRSSKVIDLDVNRKRICNFLLVINGNYESISYRFRDIDAFSSKIACFFRHTLVWCLLAEQRLAISMSSIHRWKVHLGLMVYNSVAILRIYLRSFSRCWLPKSRNHAKFRKKLTLQQFKVIQCHRSWCQSKAHMWLLISH